MTAQDEQNDDKTQSHFALTKGTRVGRYRVDEKLGAGGMGEVFLAQDTELDRKVALKFLSVQLCQEVECRKRFKREAQAAAKLKHPNIVTIYEVGEHKWRPYIAMEYIQGPSLKDMAKKGDLDLMVVTDVVNQVCEALTQAHRQGIVHRDIKPSNIMLDADGRAKLLDFGLATIRGAEPLTQTGSTLGTMGYMSPEQVEGREVDARSDLFSLGVVFYELIAGRRPFERDTQAATLKAIMQDAPQPLARYREGVSAELQRIVSKLLQKDPRVRHQSAADLAADLRKYAAAQAPPKPPVDWWNRYVVMGAVVVLAIMGIRWLILEYGGTGEQPLETERKMLAVLPFDNLGDPEDEYFADGITDEITSRLAMVHGLGVISRTSAFSYKNSEKPLPEIAGELGVDYILEGTIRWGKSGGVNRVRVTPQLIRAKDDMHLWAENYERQLDEIFEVQAAIATQIAQALDVTLHDRERQSISAPPTRNLEAYDYYLRGREYWEREAGAVDLAIQMFEKAVELDSSLYPAHAMLAKLYGFKYINAMDPSDHCLNRTREAAQKALRFAKGKPEGFIAMGYFHYYGSRDYEQALTEFHRALQQQPNNSDVLAAIGFVQRRQGDWGNAAVNIRRSLELNPLALGRSGSLCLTLWCMRRYDDVRDVVDRTLSLYPDDADHLIYKAYYLLAIEGDTAAARGVMNRLAQSERTDFTMTWLMSFDILLRDYEAAVSRHGPLRTFTPFDSTQFYLVKADAYRYWGLDSMSHVYYDSARLVCEPKVTDDPKQAYVRSQLGSAYAGLGKYREAVREAEKAVELLPVSRDAFYGPGMRVALAEIHALVGEYDLAIDELSYLLTIPCDLHRWELRMSPVWDPLRDHPRFQALLEAPE